MNIFDNIFFDNNTPKVDKYIIGFFSLLTGVLSSNFLFWLSWEHLIKAIMSMCGLAIGGVVTKITLKFYEVYLEDKIFKKKKNAKKEDEPKAA